MRHIYHDLPQPLLFDAANFVDLVLAEDEAARDLRILDLHLEGKSQREIERTIFGHNGGNAYTAVSEVIRRYKNVCQVKGVPGAVLP